jgi:hypothetical protein
MQAYETFARASDTRALKVIIDAGGDESAHSDQP